jgi:hypothetical protein
MTFTRDFLEQILPMPECGQRGRATWPDAYAGGLAPFFGEISGLPEALGRYRVHGENVWSGAQAEVQARQARFEYGQLREALARMGKKDSLAPLERNLLYLQCACGVEPTVTVGVLVDALLRHPHLTAGSKLLEVARVTRRAVKRAWPSMIR